MTEQEVNRTKDELLENISDIFLKYGLRSTSMDDICTHLKISKKTLYQFFNNKDDVVEQVMIYRRDNRQAQKNLEKLKKQSPIELILSIRDHTIACCNKEVPTNWFDLKKYHPEVWHRMKEKDEMFIRQLFDEMIDKGIREGIFREDINKDVQVYLFVKQMGLLNESLMNDETKYPPEVLVSTIMENIIRSFVTSKGMEELEQRIYKH
ncbi:MAG: TetR/AcrR family transcriptional regulator [Odoribacter sp.]|nr:TetR/AcrR family transcriptional regulator [Odoribacter sp.]